MPPRLKPDASAQRSLPRLNQPEERKPTLINLKNIRLDGGTQMRPELDSFRVEQIVDAIKAGKPIDPLEVVYDGKEYWLWDGFHRNDAYARTKTKAVACYVTPGTRRDAVKLSLSANAGHDKQPRNQATIRNVVRTALLDPEWSQLSNRELARMTQVSEYMIRTWRDKIEEEQRAEEPDPAPELDERGDAPPERQRLAKNGSIIRTSNIGSAQKQAAAKRAATAPTPVLTPATERPSPATAPVVPPPIPAAPKTEILIQEGDSWNLHNHRLYCGEAIDYSFQDVLLPSSLAFVTLPPDCYDAEHGFLEVADYDWLAKYADTIAVLIQDATAVKPFLDQTNMHYGYATGCTLYGVWGYLAFFSKAPTWTAYELDDIDTTSPNKLFTALLINHTKQHDPVIVINGPQQCGFSPLVTAQDLKRRCLLSSTYKASLQQQIANYNSTYALDGLANSPK